MQGSFRAKKVTIYVTHTAGSKHAYLRILEQLKREGAARATAFKAIAGFDARATIQTMRLADVAPDLPVMIVWIDISERVERILPHIRPLVTEGQIMVEDVELLLDASSAVADLPQQVSVGDVMSRDVVVALPDTPMAELVTDMVKRRFRSVPIVDDDRRVVGIVTNGDLVRRGGLPVRLDMLQSFDTPQLHDQLERLSEVHRSAAEVMTPSVVTIPPDTEIRQAARIMRDQKLKRLPVVDGKGRLLGIVSRVDLLRTVASPPDLDHEAPTSLHLLGTAPVSRIMSTALPAVGIDARLPEVMNVLAATRLHRVVVVDEARRVRGIVSGAEMLDRLTGQGRPDLFHMLMRRVPFAQGSRSDEETPRQAHAQRARDVMVTDVVVAREDEAIRDVLAAMLRRGHKIVPVVNRSDQLVGIVDRADLLGGLVDDETSG